MVMKLLGCAKYVRGIVFLVGLLRRPFCWGLGACETLQLF